jgi:hypothetical protein
MVGDECENYWEYPKEKSTNRGYKSKKKPIK